MKKKAIKLTNVVAIGEYSEVDNLELKTLTKNDMDTQRLNGLILKGYEMKFGETNENGERYDREAFSAFIQKYYVERGLNLPLTIQHRDDIDSLAGRVLIMEINTVGVYFVAYIPRTYKNYEYVRALLQEGILQGFSKEGWAIDYDFIFDKEGNFDYMQIKEIALVALSVVSTPANALPFEKTAEIQNALQFIENKEQKKKTLKNILK